MIFLSCRRPRPIFLPEEILSASLHYQIGHLCSVQEKSHEMREHAGECLWHSCSHLKDLGFSLGYMNSLYINTMTA